MARNRVESTVKVTLMAVVAPVLIGCNSVLVGDWKTDPVPKDEPFYIIQAKFKEEGTYEATAKKGDENLVLRGVYDFNGFRLKLESPHKPKRQYDATYLLGGTLKLKHGDKQFTMKKQ